MDPDPEFEARDAVMEIIHAIQRESKYSQWSPALRAAPGAILVMATCLRAASKPEANAIEVGKSWQGLDGEIINFPSEFLDTNLEHCSHLGRAAFREGESGMRRLQMNLQDMLGPHGTIRSIVRLLDKPRLAKYQLRDRMNNLQASADDCKENAKAIKDKFEQMIRFTSALKEATTHRQGITLRKEKENSERTEAETSNVQVYKEQLKVLKEQRKKDAEMLDEARIALNKAQDSVERANAESLQPIQHISAEDIKIFDEMNKAEDEDPGVFRRGKRWAFGKSEETKNREKIQAKCQRDARDRDINGFREQVQRVNEMQHAQALKVLEQARDFAKMRQEALDETSEKFREISENLLASSTSLENANRLLGQLGDEKLDLARTRKILQTSHDELVTLHMQIDTMLAYFKENADKVANLTASKGKLGSILQTIEAISEAAGNAKGARLMENLEVDLDLKKEYLTHALAMEGRFSSIYQIADIYLAVSKKYIIPGINRMEQLASLSNSEYNIKYEEFTRWLMDAQNEINTLSSPTAEREIDRTLAQRTWVLAVNTKMVTNTPYPGTLETENQDEE